MFHDLLGGLIKRKKVNTQEGKRVLNRIRFLQRWDEKKSDVT